MTDEHVVQRGTPAYRQKVAEVAGRWRGCRGPHRNAQDEAHRPLSVEGVLWADVWDYLYAAMSESDPRTGGLLVTPDMEGAVHAPLRP